MRSAPAAGSAALLADAGRLLRRLEGTWAEILPFLVADSRATAALLVDLAPLLDGELATAIADAAARTAGGSATLHELQIAVAAAHNDELRGLLSDAIASLPDDEAGRRATAAIGAHLRRRLDADPTNARPGRPARPAHEG